jgi:predicted membrane protein
MSKGVNDRRLLLGIVFLILGGFLLLGNLNIVPDQLYWQIKDLFWHWPMIFVVIGLAHLMMREHRFPGFFLLIFGAIFMLPYWFDLPFRFRDVFWPAVFIIVGVSILFRGSKGKTSKCWKSETFDEMDMIDDLAFFGGGDKIVVSQKFRGGKVTCVFGGINFNFLRAKLAPGKNEMDVFAVFGGMKMLVPEEWDIKIQVTSVFGGFADKRNIAPTAMENKQGELVIKGIAIFGGGEIKNF